MIVARTGEIKPLTTLLVLSRALILTRLGIRSMKHWREVRALLWLLFTPLLNNKPSIFRFRTSVTCLIKAYLGK